MKKVLSLLLSIVMLFSITFGINLSVDAAVYYESEDNNSYSNADNIPLNSSIYGNCTDNADYDWYRFTLQDSGKVDVHFDFNAKNSSDSWRVCIYKYCGSNGNKLISENKIYIYDGNYKFVTLGLPAGNYFIYAVPSSFSNSAVDGVQYKITVNYTKCSNWEKEFNDEYSQANSIVIGTTMYGNCKDNADYDWYKFTISNERTINFLFSFKSKSSSDNWRLTLYKYNGSGVYSRIDEIKIFINDKSYKSSNYGLSPGTYFISVVSSSYGKSAVDGVNYGLKVNYYVPKPSNFKVSTRNTSSLKLSWNKVSGASGYQLQRKVSGNYKHITYTSNNYYTVKNLSSATSYAFRVRAYKTINGKRYYSSWRTLTTPTKPSKVSIKTPSTNSKHQIIVKWKALSRGSGYQVQYSRKKNFSSVIATKNVSGKTKTSYTGNNFTKGKTYYVRVRAYKTVNGKKYYGAWSSVKSIKCK